MAVVLVTGGGSGIGRLIAEECAARGDSVYAAVRSRRCAEAAAPMIVRDGGGICTLELDVTRGASIEQAVGAVLADCGRIDVLVNNAGVHRLGAFEDMPEAAFREMLEVNFFGAVRTTRAVLPAMRAQRSGHVVMVSSVAAFVSRAADGFYCASKSALESAAEALRYEVARFGIRVTCVQPVAVRTDVAEKGAAALYDLADSPYERLVCFRTAKVREACANGEVASIVATRVAELIHGDGGPLRVPVGMQAQEMAATVPMLNEESRYAWIRDRSRVGWWVDGEEDSDY